MVKRAKLRKITAGLLAFMLVTSALPVGDILPIDSGVSFGITASAEDQTFSVKDSGYCGENGGQNVIWTLTENGTLPDGVTTAYKLTITGSGEMAGYDFYNRSPWNSYEKSITSVDIADGVTSIGEDAFFNCSSLESVTIPNSVKSIGGAAFYGCSALTSVTIPDSVTSIGRSAFSFCSSLTSVTIPNSVTSIGDTAFHGCSKLESVTIPNSVTSIGGAAFYGCSALTSVTIPDSVTSIGDNTFYECSKLTSVTIPNSVKSIGYGAFFCCSALESVTIPDGVKSIGASAFYECSALTSVTISNSVESIGDRAFYKCSALKSVTIPNSVTSIGNYAFSYCSVLTSVTIPCSVKNFGSYVFDRCPNTLKYHLVEGSYADNNITSTNKVYDQYHSFIGTDGNANTTDEKCLCCAVHNINFSGITVTQSELEYDGTAKTPTFTLTDKNGNVISADNYEVTVTAQTNISDNYTATITGKGDYLGTREVTWSIEKAAAPKITGIGILFTPKVSYYVGQTLDVSGGVFIAYYEDGSSVPVNMTADMVTGFDSTTAGTKTLTVTYSGQTATFNVTVAHTHTHNYAAEWSSDNTSHWHECDCGDKTDIGTHVEDSGVITVQPTTTSTGIKTYSCLICGRFLRNEELPKIEDVHTHSYSTAWNCDSTSHWHQCSCGDKTDIGSHVSNGGIVTVQPTYNSTGLRTYSCSVCGYVMRTETIPVIKPGYYPNYNPNYNTYTPSVSVTPSYSFEQIKLTGKISKNNVILKWTDVEDVDKYTVYQLIDGKYKAIKTTTENTYTVKNLPTGKHKFIVRYTVDGKISPISKSKVITVNIKNSKPYPTATVKGNIVTLKWQPVDNAEKYAIYLVKDGKATKLKEIKKTSVR